MSRCAVCYDHPGNDLAKLNHLLTGVNIHIHILLSRMYATDLQQQSWWNQTTIIALCVHIEEVVRANVMPAGCMAVIPQ